MPDIIKIVSNNLRNLMLDRDIPVKDLARQSNISRMEIYNILNRKSAARIETLNLIRSALGVDWADLLGEDWRW